MVITKDEVELTGEWLWNSITSCGETNDSSPCESTNEMEVSLLVVARCSGRTVALEQADDLSSVAGGRTSTGSMSDASCAKMSQPLVSMNGVPNSSWLAATQFPSMPGSHSCIVGSILSGCSLSAVAAASMSSASVNKRVGDSTVDETLLLTMLAALAEVVPVAKNCELPRRELPAITSAFTKLACVLMFVVAGKLTTYAWSCEAADVTGIVPGAEVATTFFAPSALNINECSRSGVVNGTLGEMCCSVGDCVVGGTHASVTPVLPKLRVGVEWVSAIMGRVVVMGETFLSSLIRTPSPDSTLENCDDGPLLFTFATTVLVKFCTRGVVANVVVVELHGARTTGVVEAVGTPNGIIACPNFLFPTPGGPREEGGEED